MKKRKIKRTKKHSPGMLELMKKIKKRVDNAEEVKKNGGNKYEQLEARLLDEDTGELTMDIVIYGIQVIDNYKDAESFYHGYIKHIEANPNKYPAESKGKPMSYARHDIGTVLCMHFTNQKTYELWEKVIARGAFTKGNDIT